MKRMVRAAALTNYFEVAQQLALNPSQMLAQVGIDRAMLADPDNRIPAGLVVTLLEESARAAQCPTFGLRMAETRQLADLGAISLLLTHKRTLREVLLAMINYRHLMNEALALQVEDVGTNVIIREEVVTDVSTHSRQATELALGVLARAAGALLGNHWKPHRVMFSHAAPPDLHLHRRIFRCKLEFGSEYNAFVCAAEDLDYPSSAANPALARYAEQLLQSLHAAAAIGSRRRNVLRADQLGAPRAGAPLRAKRAALARACRRAPRLFDADFVHALVQVGVRRSAAGVAAGRNNPAAAGGYPASGLIRNSSLHSVLQPKTATRSGVVPRMTPKEPALIENS
jgi:hypothetical protein